MQAFTEARPEVPAPITATRWTIAEPETGKESDFYSVLAETKTACPSVSRGLEDLQTEGQMWTAVTAQTCV